MKEPEISVGIVNAQEIHFTLNGNFFAKGETVSGDQAVSFSEGGILWNDPQLNIDWQIPTDKIILSEKDTRHPLLKDFLSDFE